MKCRQSLASCHDVRRARRRRWLHRAQQPWVPGPNVDGNAAIAVEQDYVDLLYRHLDQRCQYTAARLAEVLLATVNVSADFLLPPIKPDTRIGGPVSARQPEDRLAPLAQFVERRWCVPKLSAPTNSQWWLWTRQVLVRGRGVTVMPWRFG
jgi:hypothetical protein